MNGLLLDTSVVVWLLLSDRERFSQTALAAVEDETNRLVVSAASVWEIAIKRSLNKLTIDDGWPGTLSRLDLDPLPVTAMHATAVEDLPWHHRDPFDRLLVAQARVERMTLVSADEQLSAYAVDTLW